MMKVNWEPPFTINTAGPLCVDFPTSDRGNFGVSKTSMMQVMKALPSFGLKGVERGKNNAQEKHKVRCEKIKKARLEVHTQAHDHQLSCGGSRRLG